MRIITASGFWHPPLLSPMVSRLSIEQVHTATFHGRRNNGMAGISPATTGRARRSRLSPERRENLLADIREGYMKLRSTPGALGDVIAEGEFWDNVFTDQIIED